MSEQEIAITIDKAVEEKKVAVWGEFGKQLYHNELLFQLRGQQITAKLVQPTTPELILTSEQAVSIAKKEMADLVEARKVITARFKSVASRLMEPETFTDEAIKKTEAAILKAKQEQREALKTEQNKAKELKQIAVDVRIYVADMHSSYLNALASLIANAYTHALKTKIPSGKELEDFLAKVRDRVNVTTATTPPPKPAFKYNTQEVVDAEVLKHFNPWTPQQYIDGFNIDLAKKFVDWDNALRNPEQATKINAEEHNTNVAAIADQKERETLTAKLEAVAEPVSEVQAGKKIKAVYKIPEPETIAEAFVIINAFTVNRTLCEPQLNKIKPGNLGVKQMIAALESVKEQDENFTFTGLTFTLTDKL